MILAPFIEGSTRTVVNPAVSDELIAAVNGFLNLRAGNGVSIVKSAGRTVVSLGGASSNPLYSIPYIGRNEIGLLSASRMNQLIDAINFFYGIDAGRGIDISRGGGRIVFSLGNGNSIGEGAWLPRFTAGGVRTMLSCETANEVVATINAILTSEAIAPLRLWKADSGWVLDFGGGPNPDPNPPTGDPPHNLTLDPTANWNGYPNWQVVSGAVDLCGVGATFTQFDFMGDNRTMYVDLVGTPGPGCISTRATYPLVGGQTYRLSFQLAGNNRTNTGSLEQVRASVGEDIDNANLFNRIIFRNHDDDFATFTYDFLCPVDTDARIRFEQLFPNDPDGFVGCFLDDVILSNVDTGAVIFTDHFNAFYTV